MLGNSKLDNTYHFLLCALAFLFPLTVFGANLVIVIICFLWIFSGGYKNKFEVIKNSKLMIASISFFLIHVFGLLWTEDMEWGMHIVHKMWYFIGLLPILYSIVKKEYISQYMSFFLVAISFTEILSYLIWFEIIDPFHHATQSNPTPFMSHISYNPILAFAIYLVGHEILFNKAMPLIKRNLYIFFIFSMSINMFITGGRAGQVMFFAVIILLIFQYFNNQKFKAILVSILVTFSIFFVAYNTSEIFNNRVNDVVSNIKNYESDKRTSVGLRIAFTVNSIDLIKENLIFGVGTGDFPREYNKISLVNTPELPFTTNPHNMYSLIFAQLGILGITSFFMIFYYQIKLSLKSKSQFFRDLGLSLPLLYLLIMFSESYLLGHYTSLMFVFFSSFLYKDFEQYK